MNKIFTLFLLLLFCFQNLLFSCTTLVIGKKATIDGSVIVAHSDDDNFGDQRICFVPKMEFKEGDKRALYQINSSTFPRYVGTDRGEDYDIKNHHKFKPIGYIDQAKKTYSYIDANYGILNEHQLAIGECTDSTNE